MSTDSTTPPRTLGHVPTHPVRPLRIANPADMAEARGSELYPMSFNDGYSFAWDGIQLERPYWFAYREARKLGHAWPKGYAHGFCDGCRECERQLKDTSVTDEEGV